MPTWVRGTSCWHRGNSGHQWCASGKRSIYCSSWRSKFPRYPWQADNGDLCPTAAHDAKSGGSRRCRWRSPPPVNVKRHSEPSNLTVKKIKVPWCRHWLNGRVGRRILSLSALPTRFPLSTGRCRCWFPTYLQFILIFIKKKRFFVVRSVHCSEVVGLMNSWSLQFLATAISKKVNLPSHFEDCWTNRRFSGAFLALFWGMWFRMAQ